jgi:hypothetical protein
MFPELNSYMSKKNKKLFKPKFNNSANIEHEPNLQTNINIRRGNNSALNTVTVEDYGRGNSGSSRGKDNNTLSVPSP